MNWIRSLGVARGVSIGFALFSLVTSSGAQEAVPADPVGFSVPSLPDSTQGQAALRVGGTEAQSFRSLIPDALYPKVRSNELSLAVVARAPWQVSSGEGEWTQAPESDCLSGKGLSADIAWSKTRFPCGSRLTIEKSDPSPAKSEHSTAATIDPDGGKGRRYILNAERALAISGLYRSEVRIQSEGVALTDAAVRIERWAPQLISHEQTPKGAVLWREKISWLEPKAIAGSGILTLRFRGADEDMVYQRSPISRRYRQLTGSNRDDDLYGLGLAADDLSVWAAKTEWLETASFLGIKKLLVPVAGMQRVPISAGEKGCYEGQIAASKGNSVLSVWSSNLVFSPRDVAEVEVTSGDPFSMTGKMRVFIDVETMLPVIKVVYDRAGQQDRIVVGSILGLGDGNASSHYNAIGPVLTISSNSRISAVFPEFWMVCDVFSQSLNEQLFDLRSVVTNKDEQDTGARAQDSVGQRSSSASSANDEIDER